MGLTFTGADTDRVNFGSGASLDNLQALTYACWLRTTANATTTEGLVCKGTFASGNHRRNLAINGGGTTVNWTVDRATQDSNVNSNVGLTTNKWYAVFGTFDTTNGCKLYFANMTDRGALTDVTSVSTAGSGAAADDSAVDLFVGNALAGSNSMRGTIATAAVWNRALTTAEMTAQIWHPHKTSGCVLLSHLWGTGTQLDLSGNGNNGTVTGAVAGAHAPFGPLFGYDTAAQPEAYTAPPPLGILRTALLLGAG
jgi:hypothetical protein